MGYIYCFFTVFTVQVIHGEVVRQLLYSEILREKKGWMNNDKTVYNSLFFYCLICTSTIL